MGYKIKKIYQGTNQVRPELKWEPTANTVGYRPLTSSTQGNDMKTIGTKYNLSNQIGSGGSVQYGQYLGVDCCYTNVAGLYNESITRSVVGTQFSGCIFYNMGDSTGVRNLMNMQPTYASGWLVAASDNYNYNGSSAIRQQSKQNTIVTYTPELIKGEWRCIGFTYNNGTWKIYYNGQLKNTYSNSFSASNDKGLMIGVTRWSTPNENRYGDKGYFGDAVLEKKVRTDDEMKFYFNSFKSKYGL